MVRIQCKLGKKWKWGLHDYTLERAEERIKALKRVGIIARIVPLERLLR